MPNIPLQNVSASIRRQVHALYDKKSKHLGTKQLCHKKFAKREFTFTLTLENTRSAEVLVNPPPKRWHSLQSLANFAPSISIAPSWLARDPKLAKAMKTFFKSSLLRCGVELLFESSLMACEAFFVSSLPLCESETIFEGSLLSCGIGAPPSCRVSLCQTKLSGKFSSWFDTDSTYSPHFKKIFSI